MAFVVESMGTIQYDFAKHHGAVPLPGSGRDPTLTGTRGKDVMRFDLGHGDGAIVSGDVTVRFFIFEDDAPAPPASADVGPGGRSVKQGGAAGRLLFFVTFHTAMHTDGDILFPRNEVDGAYNKSEKSFSPDFAVTISLDSRVDVLASYTRSARSPRISRSVRKNNLRSPNSRSSFDDMDTNVKGEGNGGIALAEARLDRSTGGGMLLPYGLNVGQRRLRLQVLDNKRQLS